MSPLFRTRRTNRPTNRFASHRLNFDKSYRARMLLQPLEERTVPAVVLNNADSGTDSLRDLLTAANSNGVPDTITFDSSVTSITLLSALPAYTENQPLTITGNGKAVTTINAASGARLFTFSPSGATSITVTDIGLVGSGSVTGNGSGISATTAQTITLTNVSLTNFTAATSGGALATAAASTVVITGCDFTTNTSSGASSGMGGGGIFFGGATTATVDSTTFDGNRARGGSSIFSSSTLSLNSNGSTFKNGISTGTSGTSSGAMLINSGSSTVVLNNATVTGNSTAYRGGLLYSYNSGVSITISNSIISNNSAAAAGGAIYTFSTSTINLNNDTFTTNTASLTGGAVRPGGTLNVVGSTFTGNTSGGNGGAIYGTSSNTITNSIFSSNTAAGTSGGGAIMLSGGSVSSTTFTNNKTTNATGSGGAVRASGTVTFNFNDFTTNTAAGLSGALHVSSGSITVNNSTFEGNSAAGLAGAISNSGTVTVNNSTFTKNISSAAGGGGALNQNASGSMAIRSSTIYDNTASNVAAVGGAGIVRTSTSASVTITINSSIVTDNKMPNSPSTNNPDVFNNTTVTFALQGANAMVGSTTNLGGGMSFANAPVTGSNVGNLSALADNGGQVIAGGGKIRTMALTGGPAVNAGNNTISFAGDTSDQRGTGFPRIQGVSADIGAFESPDPAPIAAATSPNVTTVGGLTQSVTVVYTDLNGSQLIDFSTIDPINGTNDITITGPSLFTAPGKLVSVNPGADAKTITAVYEFTAPVNSAPGWDFSDNGVYTISMNANQVYDKDGTPNPVGAGVIGNFTASVGRQLKVTLNSDTGSDDTSTLDPNDGDLRWAVGIANLDAGLVDTITFDPSVTAITGAGTEIAVTNSMNIQGNGIANLVFTAAGSRHFNISGATSVSISGMKLTGGVSAADGGSLSVTTSTVTLTNMEISGNSATSRGGAIVLTNTTGRVNVDYSTISGNSAGIDGGALSSPSAGIGTFSVTNSTISGNNAVGNGGAVYFFTSGTLITSNSTFTGNTAGGEGGAVYSWSGTTILRNTTIAGNSASTVGGVSWASSLGAGSLLYSTIIADNLGGAEPDVGGSAANVPTNYTLIGALTTITITGANNITGTVGPGYKSAQLNPLTNNGGPTQTMLPKGSSPAVANPGSAVVTTLGGAMTNADTTVTVGSTTSFIVGTYVRVDTEIMKVTNISGVTITLTRGEDSTTPAAHSAAADVKFAYDQRGPSFDWTTLIGAVNEFTTAPGVTYVSPTLITLPGPTPNFVEVVYTSASFNIDTATIDNGDISISGILLSGTPTIIGSGGSVTVQYSFIPPTNALAGWDVSDNGTYTVTINGGQVFDDQGTPQSVDSATFNFVVGIGRALKVTLNTDVGQADTSTLDPDDGDLRWCMAEADLTPAITDTITFQASAFGNYPIASTLVFTSPMIIDGVSALNVDLDGGGLVQLFETTTPSISFTLMNMEIENGFATGENGGALKVAAAGVSVTLDGVWMHNNVADVGNDGGAIAFSTASTMNVLNSTLSGNTADGMGGAVYMPGGVNQNVLLRNSTLTGNTATTGAGGAWGGYGTYSGSFKIWNSTITGNSAAGVGGGFRFSLFSDVALSIESSIIAKNDSGTATKDIQAGDLNETKSIIGVTVGIGNLIDGGGNFNGVDPVLDPLNNNGGPTPTILANASEVTAGGSNPTPTVAFDQRGTGFARNAGGAVDIGAIQQSVAQGPIPTVKVLVGVPDVGGPSGSDYTIQVRYRDDVDIDTTTIDTNDLSVFGIGYAIAGQTAKSAVINTDAGADVTVTYTFAAPAGGFGGWNVGNYTITMNANEVTDGTNAVVGKNLDNFATTFATSLVVDLETDESDGDYSLGDRSFREALLVTNGNAGLDTIGFTGFTGTPIVVGSSLAITDEVLVNGPGVTKMVLDGGGAFQIMSINPSGSGKSVTLSGMTFQNGSETVTGGGAIYIDDDAVTLSSILVKNNTGLNGGGIFIDAAGGAPTVTINDSTFETNSSTGTSTFDGGGAIFVQTTSDLNINRSTFTGNLATNRGAGVYFYLGGNLTIDSSTFDHNTATDGGGAIGGWSPAVTVKSSTIGENSAGGNGGGIGFFSGGSLTLQNSTVFQNAAGGSGGGINLMTSTSTTMNSSIVAANTTFSGGADINGSVTISGTDNLVGVGDVGGFTLALQNQAGTGASPLPPGLDTTLALNGAQVSVTKTYAVLGGSPAINKGAALGNTYDQRGGDGTAGLNDFPRVVGSSADVGAFEFDPGPVPQVQMTVPPPAVPAPSGATFTATVVYTDDLDMDTTTINAADVSVYGSGYALSGQVATGFTIDNDAGAIVTVTYTFPAPTGGFGGNNGWNVGTYTVKMNGSEVFDNDGPPGPYSVLAATLGTFKTTFATTLVVDLQSDESDGDYSPGDRSFREALLVTNGNVAVAPDTINFVAANFNGTPILMGSSLSVTDNVLVNGPGATKLVLDGATLFQVMNISAPGTATITMSGFTAQHGAANQGAGIFIGADSVTLTDVVVDANVAVTGGGGVWVSGGGVAVLNNTKVTGNSVAAGGFGGGIAVRDDGDLSVLAGSVVSGNTADFGAGIYLINYTYLNPSKLTMTNSTVSANSVTQNNAAGIRANFADVVITNSTISLNSGGHTAGVSVNSGTVTMNGSLVTGNTATAVGGLYVGTADVIMGSSTFTANDGGNAGAMRIDNGTLAMSQSTVSGNTASTVAGGIWVIYGDATITESTISGNNGAIAGALYASYGATVSIERSTISGNSSSGGAGAISNYASAVSVINSTISGNTGLFGAIDAMVQTGSYAPYTSSTSIESSTISNNTSTGAGGGISIQNTATVFTLSNTIVAANTGASAAQADISSVGAFTFLGNFNLVGVYDSLSYTLSGANNKTGVDTAPLDPGLDPLANYGGPTDTHRLKGTSIAKDNGSTTLTIDQRGVARPGGVADDIGAYEISSPAKISNIVFGDGTAQRSMVNQMVVTFSEAVTFAGDVTAAFTLTRMTIGSNGLPQDGGTTGAVGLIANPVNGTASSVTITFVANSNQTSFGSLRDGFYDLLIDADQITTGAGKLDGENNPTFPSGDGVAGGDYVLAGNTTNKFFRLFGDRDGNGVTGLNDFGAFFTSFNNTYDPAFDYENNLGLTGLADFAQFFKRFNFTP